MIENLQPTGCTRCKPFHASNMRITSRFRAVLNRLKPVCFVHWGLNFDHIYNTLSFLRFRVFFLTLETSLCLSIWILTEHDRDFSGPSFAADAGFISKPSTNLKITVPMTFLSPFRRPSNTVSTTFISVYDTSLGPKWKWPMLEMSLFWFAGKSLEVRIQLCDWLRVNRDLIRRKEQRGG